MTERKVSDDVFVRDAFKGIKDFAQPDQSHLPSDIYTKARRERLPLWVYVITAPGNAYSVGTATFPFSRLGAHNGQPGYGKGSKSTKARMGEWQLEILLGPYVGGAPDFAKQLKSLPKGIDNLLSALKALSKAYPDVGPIFSSNPRRIRKCTQEAPKLKKPPKSLKREGLQMCSRRLAGRVQHGDQDTIHQGPSSDSQMS